MGNPTINVINEIKQLNPYKVLNLSKRYNGNPVRGSCKEDNCL
jgi:hypothetical protein